MINRKGKIQIVCNKNDHGPELNIVETFSGVLQLCVEIWKAHKRGASKVYIFFDAPVKPVKP